VVLSTVQQCTSTLGMLARRADIARHVRELTIRFQPKHTSVLTTNDRRAASAAVIDVASSKALDALRKFVWDADELPFHEDMWFALRVWYVILIDSRYLFSHLCTLSVALSYVTLELVSVLYSLA